MNQSSVELSEIRAQARIFAALVRIDQVKRQLAIVVSNPRENVTLAVICHLLYGTLAGVEYWLEKLVYT